jgi:hypothetical protein
MGLCLGEKTVGHGTAFVDTESFLKDYPIVYQAFWLGKPTCYLFFLNSGKRTICDKVYLHFADCFATGIMSEYIHIIAPIGSPYSIA